MSNKKGFTLVELLVVIAIIALLLSVLMPSLGKARTQARLVVCKSNLKQWGLAFAAYTNANNGRFWRGASGWGFEWLKANDWVFKDKGSVNFCPAALKGSKSGGWYVAKGYWGTQRDYSGSYGLSGWVDAVNPDWPGGAVFGEAKYWGTTDVKNAGNVPLLLDTRAILSSFPATVSEPPEYEGQVRTSGDLSVQMFDFAFSRHGGGVTNALFMDLSARTGGIKKLWKLKWHREYNTDVVINFSRAKWMNKPGINSVINRDF
jgi:prepilin-type N-terminal cleavage/methylation domain-containing protein/prepilin-type processing-associated H-X9-DG protein